MQKEERPWFYFVILTSNFCIEWRRDWDWVLAPEVRSKRA